VNYNVRKIYSFQTPMGLKYLLFPIKFIKIVTTIIKIKKQYNIIHIHFFWYGLIMYLVFLNNSKSKILVSCFGSDVYQEPKNRYKKLLMKKSLNFIDFVSVIHNDLKNKFVKEFGNLKPIRFARFGLPIDFSVIDNINNIDVINFKKKNTISRGKIVIVCGFSANPLREHIYILNEIKKLPNRILSNIVILIPMTYGNKKYIKKVQNHANALFYNSVEFHILSKYMDENEVACLRKSTDIIINIPKTDSFSAAMQESIYCKAIVINGAWLPYSLLDEKKIFYLKLDNTLMGSLSKLLIYIEKNYIELKKKNDTKYLRIKELSSWENNITNWTNIYNEILTLGK